jgi:hypothetical protein
VFRRQLIKLSVLACMMDPLPPKEAPAMADELREAIQRSLERCDQANPPDPRRDELGEAMRERIRSEREVERSLGKYPSAADQGGNP